MSVESLSESLLDNYVLQKVTLLEKAGYSGQVNRNRLREFAKTNMRYMAGIVADWFIDADILMEAMFDWARFNRHPDGPMPNMFRSEKYIVKALSHYLQVPYEVVAQKKCQDLFLERRDFEYRRVASELKSAGVTDLVSASSYPIEIRYMMAVHRLDMESAFFMAQELLERMREDRRVSFWLQHRRISYEIVARQFNRMKKKRSE